MFQYCLNTSTIKGQGLSLRDEVALTARVGYDGIEPWVSELDAFTAAGGDVDALGREIADLGLSVENLIGFFAWAVDDDVHRAEGLAEARRAFDLARRLGAKRVAAPPMGVMDGGLDLDAAAARYRDLLTIGTDYGVVPILEFWGMSRSLGRFSECLYVAAESGRRDACILADVFHIYKSGGNFDALRLAGPETLGLFHMNDYPAGAAGDAERVYPGDGVAPLAQILADLRHAGFHGMLSLELFNPTYYAQDAEIVARTGLAKMKALAE